MREQNAPTPPAGLEDQAWNWLRLLTSGDARDVDAQRFRRWVQASPAHRAAYQEVKLRWDAIEPSARALLQLKPDAATVQARASGLPVRGRRVFLGAAMAAAAVTGMAVLRPPMGLWPAPDEWAADDRTAAGEQRPLRLSDGIEVTLNTRTSVRRQTEDGQPVGLDLIVGEAAIGLKPGGPPFAVVAGVGRSQAMSGQFEVRHLEGKVCVTCIEGAVRVQHPAGLRSLTARQQTVYSTSAISGIAHIDPRTVSAWREGMLVFDQTRLEDALAEINRYRAGRVVLMNDALRGKPVSGRFAIAALDLALWQVQEAFGLQARSLPGGLLLLS
ncbi:FecR family protein [Variovorax sp. LT1R16]|uniref:FecR family protein n=1 Tax=Variovorax sp. LT1R16 TaxID=3443728 RepID=UPI003F48C2FA